MTLPIRKIEPREESERKRKRNTLYLSIVMIAILVFSTAGYFSLQNEDSGTGTNEKVQNVGDSWVFSYGDQTFRLTNAPEDGQNVSILSFVSLDKYSGKTVYVSSEGDAVFYEIYSSLGVYTERMQQACYGKCSKNLPEKDCNETMIVIRDLNETESLKTGSGKVYEEGN